MSHNSTHLGNAYSNFRVTHGRTNSRKEERRKEQIKENEQMIEM